MPLVSDKFTAGRQDRTFDQEDASFLPRSDLWTIIVLGRTACCPATLWPLATAFWSLLSETVLLLGELGVPRDEAESRRIACNALKVVIT